LANFRSGEPSTDLLRVASSLKEIWLESAELLPSTLWGISKEFEHFRIDIIVKAVRQALWPQSTVWFNSRTQWTCFSRL